MTSGTADQAERGSEPVTKPEGDSTYFVCWWCGGSGKLKVPAFLPYSDPIIREMLDAYCADESVRDMLDDISAGRSVAPVDRTVSCPRCSGSGLDPEPPCGKPAIPGAPWPPSPGSPGWERIMALSPQEVIWGLFEMYRDDESFRERIDRAAGER